MFAGSIVWKGIVYALLMIIAKAATGAVLYVEYWSRGRCSKKFIGPRTEEEELHSEKGQPHAEALLVGFAMVARGEIGFLIASLSQSSGTLVLKRQGLVAERNGNGDAGTSGEDVFLVIIWAVVLCTIVGPVAVGMIVRRQAQQNR